MRPGSVIDERYELLHSIGVGSAAEVFAVKDLQNGQTLALKLQTEKGARNRRLKERFLREARLMMAMKHPNLLPVLDMGVSSDERLFLVMPLVAEGTLLDRMNGESLPTHLQGLSAIFQLLCGLAVVHDTGAIHRDIKMANILVPSWDRVMLADFGIARSSKHSTLTRADATLGSAGYMPPEQQDDSHSVGPQADLFALGVVLFQLMARRRAPDLSLAEFEPQLLKPVPRPVRPIVSQACRHSADDRYPTARDMALDVAKVTDLLLTMTHRPAIGDAWMQRFDQLRHAASG